MIMENFDTVKTVRFRMLNGRCCEKQLTQQIADIHMQTFTGFFLSFLGKNFLTQLYEGYCSHLESGLIIAEEEDRIVGFLAYSKNLTSFYKYLICKSWYKFAWYSLGAAIRKPSTMKRLVRALLKPRESKRDEPFVELSSIGVLPEVKNQHIGSQLINMLKSEFDPQKFTYIKLETDAENNTGTNLFYLHNGFVLNGNYTTPEGRSMNEYRYYPELQKQQVFQQ